MLIVNFRGAITSANVIEKKANIVFAKLTFAKYIFALKLTWKDRLRIELVYCMNCIQ